MKWIGRRGSSNIEDARGASGGGGRNVFKGGCLGIIIVIVVWLLGGNPMDVIRLLMVDNAVEQHYQPANGGVSEAKDDSLAMFVSVVLADTEDVWSNIFNQMGATYRKPKLVLYRGAVSSACGYASKATGPFYCPGDEKIYIDLSFYDEMGSKLGAGGDFAFAYVIAHEVGHHVQKLLGIMDEYNVLSKRMNQSQANALTVKLELQADFYAGLWAHYAQKMFNSLEPGDIDEAMNAASAVGDDRLQKQSQGYVVPDSFTHGTSAQRKKWFYKGYETGNIKYGDTFSTSNL